MSAQPRDGRERAADLTVIAREDRLDGNVRAQHGIRVLGTAKGRLEAPSVVIEEGASVTASITADNVLVAGEYNGKMICRQRLEVGPSGRISGRVETLKLMLHEGAVVDGEIHMTKRSVDADAPGAPVRGTASRERTAVASSASESDRGG
jgi:cytoskeletal protein CcmA (bactofilin family)